MNYLIEKKYIIQYISYDFVMRYVMLFLPPGQRRVAFLVFIFKMSSEYHIIHLFIFEHTGTTF